MYRAPRKFERISAPIQHVGAGYIVGLRWREIETVFESRILTDAIINSNHTSYRTSQIPGDARNVNERVTERNVKL